MKTGLSGGKPNETGLSIQNVSGKNGVFLEEGSENY